MKSIHWQEEKVYPLNHALWQTTYTPKTYGQLVYQEDKVYVHMFVEEKNPKAIYTQMNEPVYKDSCMECFMNVNPKQSAYMNFEVNANGAMLVGFGQNRKERLSITPSFKPIPYQNDKGWGFILEIPSEFLKFYFGEIASTWKVNFYKCGDDCKDVHFLSWNYIDLETPNYHCPEYFGEISF